jgi:hypothetical protein
MSKNPFQEEESLLFWLKSSSQYQKKQAQNLHKFRSKNFTSKNPFITFFMQIKTLLHLTYKSTALAVLGGILFTGTVAVAAQTLAPNEYKPSEFFKKSTQNFSANKLPDKDPYTALAPDENNFVANLESCDLALKYPKEIKGIKSVYSSSETDDPRNSISNYEINFNTLEPIPKPNLELGHPEYSKTLYKMSGINFFCQNIQPKSAFDSDENSLENTLPTKQNITKNELQNKTGWLITEVDIKNIQLVKGSGIYKDTAVNPDTGMSYETGETYQTLYLNEILEFDYNNKNYTVNLERFRNDQTFVDFKDFQLQFSSLTNNKFSDNLPQKYEKNGSFASSCLSKLLTSYPVDYSFATTVGNTPFFDDLNSKSIYNYNSKHDTGSVLINCGSSSSENLKRLTTHQYKKESKNLKIDNIGDFQILDPNNKIKSIIELEIDTEKSSEKDTKTYLIRTSDNLIFSIILHNPQEVKNSFDLKIEFK